MVAHNFLPKCSRSSYTLISHLPLTCLKTLYLRAQVSEWPINRDFAPCKKNCIPSNEVLKQFSCLIQMSKCSPSASIQDLVEPMCTDDWHQLVCYIQIFLTWFYLVQVDNHTETKILEHAKKLWFLSTMPETIEGL